MAKNQQKDIEEYISKLSDEELVNYIHATEGTYLPEAIAFARQVLESRHLSPQKLAGLEELATSQRTKGQMEQSTRTSVPIAWYWKPWIVLCGLFVPLLVPAYVLIGTSVRFFISGEKRKARQFWMYGIIGLVLLVLGLYSVSEERGEITILVIVPVVPSIFLWVRLRHYLNLPKDALPALSEMEFKRMKSVSGAAFGILGISIILVFITSAFLYKLTIQSVFFRPRNIAVVGIGIAILLDLKADGIKKRGNHN